MDEEEKMPAGYDVATLDEYDFSPGVWGKHAKAAATGGNEMWLAKANAPFD